MNISKKQLKKLKKTTKAYGLDFVALFGSQARGKTHKKSDIDIAIKNQTIFFF